MASVKHASVILVANLQIKDLPQPIHEELRRRAGLAGTTMREYVLRLLLADQALPPREEWLARVTASPTRPRGTGSPDVAALIRSDRADREAELARRAG